MSRITAAQALVRFLAAQHVERDGVERRFFAGCFGIFGHGNVAGIGQALYQHPDFLRYYQARNEQAMVHAAVGFARMKNRLATLACTTSIGPGATNLVTGAALATVNRLPVLLLPGDVFASRRPDPVLQQLEVPSRGDVSVNDALQPVTRYFDRSGRPEQLLAAAPAAMRVLVNQAETGAVTLAFPQDVQVEAYDYPDEFLAKRVWHVTRPEPDSGLLADAASLIRSAKRPLMVAGGGVIYSEATDALRAFAEQTGIPVAETQAGKGSLPYDHPSSLGAIGATGTFAANRVAADADVVIGIGTRWSDFTTASKTAFRNDGVRFVNVNIADFDAAKHAGFSCMGYEIAGGLGVKLAAPERDVYVLVGDGSYLMLSSELVTAVQERQKLTIVLVDNRGFKSIGGLSRSLGMDGFGTLYRYRQNGSPGVNSDESPDYLPCGLAGNPQSLRARGLPAPPIP